MTEREGDPRPGDTVYVEWIDAETGFPYRSVSGVFRLIPGGNRTVAVAEKDPHYPEHISEKMRVTVRERADPRTAAVETVALAMASHDGLGGGMSDSPAYYVLSGAAAAVVDAVSGALPVEGAGMLRLALDGEREMLAAALGLDKADRPAAMVQAVQRLVAQRADCASALDRLRDLAVENNLAARSGVAMCDPSDLAGLVGIGFARWREATKERDYWRGAYSEVTRNRSDVHAPVVAALRALTRTLGTPPESSDPLKLVEDVARVLGRRHKRLCAALGVPEDTSAAVLAGRARELRRPGAATRETLNRYHDTLAKAVGFEGLPTWAELTEEITNVVDALNSSRDEVARLKRDGSPGVMHEVDRAFLDLSRKERDLERVRVDGLRADLDEMRRRLRLALDTLDTVRAGVAEGLEVPVDEVTHYDLNARVQEMAARLRSAAGDTTLPQEVRPFSALRDSGLLWLVNRELFHPRGYALGLHMRDGVARGWTLSGDGSEAWRFEDGVDMSGEVAATLGHLPGDPVEVDGVTARGKERDSVADFATALRGTTWNRLELVDGDGGRHLIWERPDKSAESAPTAPDARDVPSYPPGAAAGLWTLAAELMGDTTASQVEFDALPEAVGYANGLEDGRTDAGRRLVKMLEAGGAKPQRVWYHDNEPDAVPANPRTTVVCTNGILWKWEDHRQEYVAWYAPGGLRTWSALLKQSGVVLEAVDWFTPPVGWANRIDEVLWFHGLRDEPYRNLSFALANLVRSWIGSWAHDADHAPGGEWWGPRTPAASALEVEEIDMPERYRRHRTYTRADGPTGGAVLVCCHDCDHVSPAGGSHTARAAREEHERAAKPVMVDTSKPQVFGPNDPEPHETVTRVRVPDSQVFERVPVGVGGLPVESRGTRLGWRWRSGTSGVLLRWPDVMHRHHRATEVFPESTATRTHRTLVVAMGGRAQGSCEDCAWLAYGAENRIVREAGEHEDGAPHVAVTG